MNAHRYEVVLYVAPLLATLVAAGDVDVARLTFAVTTTTALVLSAVIRSVERASRRATPRSHRSIPIGRSLAEVARAVPIYPADADPAAVERALQRNPVVLLRRGVRFRFLDADDPWWRELASLDDIPLWHLGSPAPIIDGAWTVADIDEATRPRVAVVTFHDEILGAWLPAAGDTEARHATLDTPRHDVAASRPAGDPR